MIQFPTKRNFRSVRAFSLVEVTIALGLVSYTLLGLLGLFIVGLNSNRESTMETALAQIALHVSSSYNGALNADGKVVYQRAYTYEGSHLLDINDASKYFTVDVEGQPSSDVLIPDTTGNLHLITVSIASVTTPDSKKVIQTSAYVP